ncbi:putative multiple-sugar transport system permease YteP [Paenibacillus allorhizoplanae]|uniref:Multiple-sugar transport system permease YteP n=1 Tax=Paenibacillus allorhizoplanae TaxID=2905648 RepID=A0ABN8FTK0_9BACL|nr:ABC transporter permease subunit [Paenibacillus allorhizoplanae]CAH1191671.1 putative multiple-sugar transport system permease YteP [Paenibacillus allorhizoplanae]
MSQSNPPSTSAMVNQKASPVKTKSNWLVRKYGKRILKQNIPLYIMFVPIIAFFLIFKYYPMTGLVIAFKKYSFIKGIWGSPWAGLDNFKMIFQTKQMYSIVWNTFKLSGLSIILGFPAPIILALLLNEVRKMAFKRLVQTLVYLPHFLNWVIVGGIVVTVFSQSTGTLSHVIEKIFGESYPFLYKEGSWISIFLAAGIWKEAGWNAIIFLAALTGIDQSLYEASSIDGANKWQQTFRITIPAIMPTIIIVLILKIGHLLELGFDQVYVLQNNAVLDISEVISTFNYKIGIQQANFSLATAMGLFESLVGLILVLAANRIARRFGNGLW